MSQEFKSERRLFARTASAADGVGQSHFFLVMEVGLRLAEEVIDANVASDGKRLLTGLSVFPVIA